MPWVNFTADDVKSRLAERELETYEDAAGLSPTGEQNVDLRMDAIVSQVLGQFRGKIRSNINVSALGPDGTLPDFCIAPAAIIARVGMLGLNPIAEGQTDPRRDEYQNAIKELNGLDRLNPAAFALADPTSSDLTGGNYGGYDWIEF